MPPPPPRRPCQPPGRARWGSRSARNTAYPDTRPDPPGRPSIVLLSGSGGIAGVAATFSGIEGSLEPMGDLRQGCPRREDLGHSCLVQYGYVARRDDAAAHDEDVIETLAPEPFDHLRHEREMGARQQRQTDGVSIFLNSCLHNLFRRLVQPGVDHFKAC